MDDDLSESNLDDDLSIRQLRPRRKTELLVNDGTDGTSRPIEVTKFRPMPMPEEGLKTLKTLQMQQKFLETASKDDKYKRNKFCRYYVLEIFFTIYTRVRRQKYLDKT